jgi:DNA-binding MarR family transcriptional regulator
MSQTVDAFRSTLRRIERAVGLQAKDDATCCGVTVAQCHALVEIGAHEGLSVQTLARRLGLDKSTLSRTVDGLVRDGLADRSADPDDRRAAVVRLTEQGRDILAGIHTTWDGWSADLFQRIPSEKHAIVLEALALVADALEGIAAPNFTCCRKGG